MKLLKNKIKNIVLSIGLIAISISVVAILQTGKNAYATGGIVSKFNSYGITMVPTQNVPPESGINDNRKGLLLKSDVIGSKIQIKNTLQGEFEIDFRVYSDETFSGSATSGIYENNALDLRKMHFNFIGDNGKTFSVYFEGGVGGNNVSPNTYVNVNGEKSGLYYDSFDKLIGNTKYYNSNGCYTVLNGTSFSNAALIGDTLTTVNCESTVLKFDPSDMSVYAGANNSDLKLVWSMTEEEIDGKKAGDLLESFVNYNVEIVFDEIKANKTAKLLINGINGVSTNWDYVNSDKVVLSANVEYNAVKNEAYHIPDCHISNWIKNVSGEVDVKVVDSTGNEIEVNNNSFIPTKEGEYTVIYTYNDAKKEYVINAVSEAKTSYVLEDKYSEFTLGEGAEISLLPCKYTSNLLVNGFTRNSVVTVYKDNEVVNGYNKINLTKLTDFVFEQSGEYKVEYSSLFDKIENKLTYIFDIEKDKVVFDNQYINGIQYLNGTVTVPVIKAHYNGETYDTEFNFVMPDGSRYKNKSYKLTQVGKYAIEYTATVNGQKYVKTIEFNVVYRASDLFEGENYTITTESYFINDNVSGAKLSTSISGSVAKYKNDVIFENESQIKKIVSLIIVPTNKGIKDFEDVYVQLTDKTNSSNKIVFMIGSNKYISGNEKALVIYSGTDILSPQNNVFYSTFYGNYQSTHGAVEETVINLGIDYKNKFLYASVGSNSYTKIADLTDITVFGSAWKGFTDDRAELSFTTNNLISTNASFIVTSVDGNNLSGERIIDNVSPDITIDYKGYDVMNLPKGQVNKLYNLFKAYSFDNICGAIDVSTKVYKNYGLSNQYEIYCKNNQFTPFEEGVYTVVNTSTDALNNTTVKSYNIEVVSEKPTITINHLDFANTGTVGSKYTFGEFNIAESVIGVALSKTVYYNGEEYESDAYGFTPNHSGNYTVKLLAKDYVGNETVEEISVVVTLNKNPLFGNEPLLPYAYVNGNTYELPVVEAFYYDAVTEERKNSKVEVFVSYDGSAYTKVLDNRVSVQLPGVNEELFVKYVSTNDYGTNEIIKAVKVVKVRDESNKIAIANLFYSTDANIEVSTSKEGATYKTTEDSCLYFANPIIADEFTLAFNVNEANNQFSNLKIHLIDYNDPNVEVVLDIYKNSIDTKVCSVDVNGEKGTINGSFFNNITGNMIVSYNKQDYCIYDSANEKVAKIFNTKDGENFVGFTSNLIKLYIEFSGVEGCAGITVSKISNKTINTNTNDRTEPIIFTVEEIPSIIYSGEQLIIRKAYAFDIIDGECDVKVTVNYLGLDSRDNLSVSDDNGVELTDLIAQKEYTLSNGKNGYYRITYTATDKSGNIKEIYCFVTIVDDIAPTLELTKALPQSIKVGQTVDLTNYSVADNNDVQYVKVVIFVINSSYRMTMVKDGEYTFTEKGTYMVRYYVFDGFNNSNYYDYEVSVNG